MPHFSEIVWSWDKFKDLKSNTKDICFCFTGWSNLSEISFDLATPARFLFSPYIGIFLYKASKNSLSLLPEDYTIFAIKSAVW